MGRDRFMGRVYGLDCIFEQECCSTIKSFHRNFPRPQEPNMLLKDTKP